MPYRINSNTPNKFNKNESNSEIDNKTIIIEIQEKSEISKFLETAQEASYVRAFSIKLGLVVENFI